MGSEVKDFLTTRARPSSMAHMWGEVIGSQGSILAIWWLLSSMAGIFHASSRIVGSSSVPNSPVVRTGLPINKSTCYGMASGLSNLIQALLMWYERNTWGPHSHHLSIKGRLCPLEMGPQDWQGCFVTVYSVASGRKQSLTSMFPRQREDVVWFLPTCLCPLASGTMWGLCGAEVGLSPRAGPRRGKGRSRQRRSETPTSEVPAPDFSWRGVHWHIRESPQLLKEGNTASLRGQGLGWRHVEQCL